MFQRILDVNQSRDDITIERIQMKYLYEARLGESTSILLPGLMCLMIILGCRGNFGSVNSDKTPANISNNSSAPSNTPDAYPGSNRLMGTWIGKNANKTGDLKMVFTRDEWTLYANGKMIAAPLKYVPVDENTIEVTGRDGGNFPLKYSVTGDRLETFIRDTKVVLKRAL